MRKNKLLTITSVMALSCVLLFTACGQKKGGNEQKKETTQQTEQQLPSVDGKQTSEVDQQQEIQVPEYFSTLTGSENFNKEAIEAINNAVESAKLAEATLIEHLTPGIFEKGSVEYCDEQETLKDKSEELTTSLQHAMYGIMTNNDDAITKIKESPIDWYTSNFNRNVDKEHPMFLQNFIGNRIYNLDNLKPIEWDGSVNLENPEKYNDKSIVAKLKVNDTNTAIFAQVSDKLILLDII